MLIQFIKRTIALSISSVILTSIIVSLVLFLIISIIGVEYRNAKANMRNHPLTECGHPLKNASVPMTLISGILAQEDSGFFKHSGFNWNEVEESIKKNVSEGKVVRGASTIDMQVASLCYLKDVESRWIEKFREVLYTHLINVKYEKNEILRAYLTIVPLIENSDKGGFLEGARFYYGKSLNDLTYDEQWALIITLRSRDKLNPNALKRRATESKGAKNTLDTAQPKQQWVLQTYRDYMLKNLPYASDE